MAQIRSPSPKTISGAQAGAAGGGVEWMFAPRWSLKVEGLYYDLGHVTLNTSLGQTDDTGAVNEGAAIASEIHYRGAIARAGVNYHF